MRACAVLLVLVAGCATQGRGRDGGSGGADLGGGGMGGTPGGLVSAGSWATLVLTPDNSALVTDAQATLHAIPLAGGAPRPLEAHVTAAVRIADAVFVWHDVDAQLSGGLAVFVGGQLRELSPASPAAVDFPSSAASDGLHVAFLGNLNSGDADLMAQHSDGSGQVTLAQRLHVSAGCAPALAFVAGKLIVSRCDSGGFAVAVYDPDSGGSITLLTPASPGFVPVPARAAVVALNDMNGSSLYPVDGSPRTPLAATVKRSLPLADGSAVVQLTLGGGIVRARLPDGGLTSLVASGGDELETVSPDGAWVLYTGPPDAASGDAALFLASASQSSNATAINSDKTTPPLVGGRFSDDAAFVLYTTDADHDGFGPLRARPLGGAIGPSRTLSLASTGFLTAGGARLVYADHYTPAGASAARIDLQLIDLARAMTPTLMASGASLAWRLSDDARTLAYLVSDGRNAGLYAAALP